jgi:hypothetical protein
MCWGDGSLANRLQRLHSTCNAYFSNQSHAEDASSAPMTISTGVHSSKWPSRHAHAEHAPNVTHKICSNVTHKTCSNVAHKTCSNVTRVALRVHETHVFAFHSEITRRHLPRIGPWLTDTCQPSVNMRGSGASQAAVFHSTRIRGEGKAHN